MSSADDVGDVPRRPSTCVLHVAGAGAGGAARPDAGPGGTDRPGRAGVRAVLRAHGPAPARPWSTYRSCTSSGATRGTGSRRVTRGRTTTCSARMGRCWTRRRCRGRARHRAVGTRVDLPRRERLPGPGAPARDRPERARRGVALEEYRLFFDLGVDGSSATPPARPSRSARSSSPAARPDEGVLPYIAA